MTENIRNKRRIQKAMRLGALILGNVIALAAIIAAIVINLSNPDMTDTRLLLTFWKEYVAIIILFLLGAVLVGKNKN